MSKKDLAIANCRVSSFEQLQNNSLSRQQTSVEAFADTLGAEIICIWSGSVSSKAGTNITRKDLQEMLDTCKKNKRIKYIIIDELDRFMRSILEIGYFLVLFKQLGVEVVFASQPNLKTDTAANTLLLMLEAYKAEGSNEERQGKSISGQTTALQAGRYPFSPKPGYMRGEQAGIPEIHPVRGPALRDVLIRIAEHQVTPTQGLVELNKSDYTQERAQLKMDKFRKIATDPFNAGIVEINKQVNVRNESGLHEPLISKEQHNELVRIMSSREKNQRGPRKNGNPKYPCNNIVTCSKCIEASNGRIVGFNHTNGRNQAVVYEKYRCRACGQYTSRRELHEGVERRFKDNPVTEGGVNDLVEALNIAWKEKEGESEALANRIQHKINTLKTVIENQVLAATDPSNVTIKDEILESIAKRKDDVEGYEKELEQLKNQVTEDREEFMRFAFKFVEDMGSKFLEISHENRLRCKQIVFPGGFYLGENKKVYTTQISPLITLAAQKKDAETSLNSHLVRAMRL